MLSRVSPANSEERRETAEELLDRRRREITRRSDLPDLVVAVLRNRGIDPEDLDVAVASDLGEDGRFGEKWLVATGSRLVTVAVTEGNADLQLDLAMARFKTFVAEAQVGSGMLEEITEKGEVFEIIRYSNALGRQFPQVAKHLQILAEGEGKAFVPDAKVQENVCPSCGRILLHGSLVCPKCVRRGRTLRRLIRYALKYKLHLAGVWTLLILTTATDLAPPYITKILVDRVFPSGGRNTRLLAGLVIILAATRLVGVLLRVVQQRLSSMMAISVTYDIRRDVFSALQKQSLSFFDTRKTGNLMSRVLNDTRKLLQFLVNGIQYLIVNLLTLLGIGVMLFLINWQLAIYVLAPVPLVIFITKKIWRRVKTAHYRVHVRWAQVSGVLNDALSGIRVVKAFGQEEREIGRFDEESSGLLVAGLEEAQLSQTLFPMLGFITSSGALLIWWVGGQRVMNDEVTLGTLIAFLAYLTMFYAPLRTLTNMSSWLTRALTASERVFEIMDARVDVQDASRPKRLAKVAGRFEFKDVTFGYDVNVPVLKHIDLAVEPGEMIGLVGKSGVGKSTLINLICRFYDVSEGAILVDGIDLRELSLDDYRRHLGVVLQEPFLFSGTLRENISYPRSDTSRETVIRAARLANAHEFIMGFPDGYDMQVGERGGRLSGGERQRIAIARAILHNPQILILDEATASVDTQTEQLIQEALSRLIEGRTVFAIAHRLSTLRNADRLVVLDDGEIVEIGTHEELTARRGIYNRLVEMQRQINEIKSVGG